MDLNGKNEVDIICELGLEYLYLAELISADILIDLEECIKSRRELNRFNHDLKLSKVNEEKKKELQKFIDDAYKIIEQEIEKYGGKLDSEDQTGK